MSDIVAPLINGRRFSYASLEIVATIGATARELFIDCEEISYNESLVIAFKNGTASVPLGSTRGVWEPQECSMMLGKSKFQQMVMDVGPGWLGLNLSMLVTYRDIGEIFCFDTIIGRIIRAEDAHAHGPDPLKTNLIFIPTTPILRNGIPSMLNRVV